ncbi:MAG: HAD hydrolase-like protein [Patescibacteria group bacterium]|jgi:phosphoglycolate phosphatase|nr:HAD hydrolase-like protein [Patescibacteria group bacterium]
MKKKYVVTDVDGVLLDRMPVYGEIFSELLRTCYGIDKKFSKKLFFSTAGTPIDKQFALAISESCFVKITSVISKLEKDFFIESAKREVSFFPRAKEVIAKLNMVGCTLFASSGSQTRELEKIFLENMLPYRMILGSNEIKRGPEHIKIFAENVYLSIEEFAVNAVYIGDGPRDMEIARECNMLAIGILTCPGVSEENLRNAGADYVINDISELPTYVL